MPVRPLDENQLPTNPSANNEGINIAGGQSFEEYGSSLPSDARSFLDQSSIRINQPGDQSYDPEAPNEPPAPRKTVVMSKKMKKSLDKFRKKVATLPTRYFDNLAKQRPEWALDDDERDLLSDSVETLFELLDIRFEFQAIDVALTSIWWVVAYPVLAFSFVLLGKKALIQSTDQQEQTEPTDTIENQ